MSVSSSNQKAKGWQCFSKKKRKYKISQEQFCNGFTKKKPTTIPRGKIGKKGNPSL